MAVTGTNPATAKSTLTATELAAMVEWSYTLDEDAVVALMPEIRGRLAQAGGEAIDGFAFNADSTNAAMVNINTDDAAPVAMTTSAVMVRTVCATCGWLTTPLKA